MGKTRLILNYNPYTLEGTSVMTESGVILNVLLPVHKNKRLQEWLYPYAVNREKWIGLYEAIADKLGSKSYTIKFKGRKIDYDDLCTELAELGEEYSVDIEYEQSGEYNEKMKQLCLLYKQIEETPLESIRPDFLKPLKMVADKEFMVGIFGKMSCGKTTLINSLIGHKLLSSAAKKCTSKIFKIADTDKLDTFRLNYYDKALCEEKVIENITPEIMNSMNENPNYENIRLEGNIEFINNSTCNLVLVDTPGSNSDCKQDREIMDQILNSDSQSLIVFIFDAGDVESEDTQKVLEDIADYIKGRYGQDSEKFIILINKMYDLITTDDDVEEKVETVKRKLQDVGIKNPKVFTVDALSALVLKMSKKPEIKLNIKERNQTELVYGMLEDDEYKKYDLSQYAPKTEKYKQILIKEFEKMSKVDKALNYTGLPAFESEIVLYIEKYAFPIKVKDFYDSFMKIFNEKIEIAEYVKKASQEITENIGKLSEAEKREDEAERKQKIANLSNGMDQRIKEIRAHNKEMLDELYRYIEDNKSEIIGEIKSIADEFTGTSAGPLPVILAIISVFVPGGWITTGIGSLLSGVLGFGTSAMDENKIESIRKKVEDENGALGTVRKKYSDVIEKLERSFKETSAKLQIIKNQLGLEGEYAKINFSNHNIELNIKKIIKKSRGVFLFNKINEEKLEKQLTEGFSESIESSVNGLIYEYQDMSETLIDEYSDDINRVIRILKEAEEQLKEAKRSEDALKQSIDKRNREIEWINQIKKQLTEIIEM